MLFFFFQNSIVKAQENTLSKILENKLLQTMSDSLRVETLLKLSSEYKGINLEKTFETALAANKLAKEKKIQNLESVSISKMSDYYIRNNEDEKAKMYADSAMSLAKKCNNEFAIAHAYAAKANIFLQTEQISLSLENYLASLRIREKINDSVGIAVSNIGLCRVYQMSGKLELAEKHALISIEILKKLDENRLLVNSLQSLANIYGQTEKYNKALEIDEEALLICEKQNYTISKAMIYSNMANCYLYLKQLDKSIFYHKQVLKIDRLQGDKQLIADSYFNIGNAYLENGQFDLAENWLNDAFIQFKEINNLIGMRDASYLLSRSYSALGNYKKALEMKTIQFEYADSLLNSENLNQIAELQTKYETEKKDLKINDLNQINTIQKLELKSRNLYLFMIALFLIGSGIMGILIHNRIKLKQESKFQAAIILQQDQASTAIVDAEERESKRIAGDLHDGIGQLFAAVKLNLSGMSSDVEFKSEYSQHLYAKTLDLVDDACSEVRTISHNMMPNVLLKAGLASAMREFVSRIDVKKLNVNLETNGLNERLDSKVEMVLYRVIQESVNNVIKHAKASQLDIQISKDENEINVTIEDNGNGFNTDLVKNAEGIGLKNIKSRVDFLKGEVEWDSALGRGTVVSIHIPIV